MGKKHILFVCDANKHRSVAAEELYKDDARYEVRPAGTRADETRKSWRPEARQLASEDVDWADRIFAFGNDVYDRLLVKYPASDPSKVIALDIRDIYDTRILEKKAELRQLILERLEPYLGKPQRQKGS